MRDCTQLTAADKAALLTHYLENSSARDRASRTKLCEVYF